MRRVGANVAGASVVIVALALVASQTLFSAASERSRIGAEPGDSGVTGAEEGRGLLAGEPRASQPGEPGRSLAPRTPGASGVGNAGRAVTPVPLEARPAPSSPRASGTVAVSVDRGSREREVVGDEPRLAISEITSRARVAIRAVLVGDVTEVEQEGASYEVEFESADDDLEVVLDRAFDLMVAEIDDDDPAPTAAQVEQARAAARAMAALGDVIEVEREDEGFEVELARPDGTVLEVELDLDLNLVAVETESD